MNQLFNFALHTASSAISLYLFYYFFATFFPQRTKKTSRILLLTVSEVLFVLSLTVLFDFVLVRLVVSTLVIVAVSMLFRMKWYYHIIMSITLYAMLSIAEYATGSLVSILFSIDMKTGGSGKYFVIGLFLSKAISFFFIQVVRMAKYRFTNTRFHRNLLATFVVPIATMSVILLQYGFMTHTDEVSLSLSFLSLFCFTALIVSNILIFDWLDTVSKSVEKDVKLAAADELIALQAKQYRDMIEHNRHIAKIRHDYKNFLLGVLAELESPSPSGAKAAVTQELEELNSPNTAYLSQGTVGVILEHKKALAETKGVELEAALSEIQSIRIPSVDLSIVLGNALDNAIEAAEKVSDRPKRVALKIKAVNNTVVITVKNPTALNVDVNDLRSTKSDKSLHGFGLYSIQSIAKKYAGEVICQCESREFKITILLKNNDSSSKSDE